MENVDYWTTDRVCKDVPVIENARATIKDIYSDDGLPKLGYIKEHFSKEGRFTNEAVEQVVNDVKKIFKHEPNLLMIDSDLIICGDVHGQFYDLLKLFEVGGDPATNKYLFLGDYVDRGSFSVECLLYLYCHKIRYPNTFFMLRGNHECRHLTEYFTFKSECKAKYELKIYDLFCDSFNFLPLAAVVKKMFFCVHGGLSPEIIKVKDVNKINRFCEPPSSGAFCDLLWADPHESFGKEITDFGFAPNNVRGCSFYFSFSACCNFLAHNSLLSVIRAHEAQDLGYKMYKQSKSSTFPALITIFSAPNYLDVYNNKAAILKLENSVLNIRQFYASPHPYWLPNFMDVFTWSVPFVGEKITAMLEQILNVCSTEDFEEAEEGLGVTRRREIIRNKILAVGKMSKVFSVLRDESLSVIKLKGLTPSGSLPTGLLSGGRDSLLSALEQVSSGGQLVADFDQVRKFDLINERLPPPMEKHHDS